MTGFLFTLGYMSSWPFTLLRPLFLAKYNLASVETTNSCAVFFPTESAEYSVTHALMVMRRGNSPPTSMGSPCTCVRNPSMNAFISALESPSATMANSSPPIRKAENLASESLESFFPICRRTWSQAACQNPSLTRLKLSMSNIANPIRSTAHSATFDTSFSRCESKCLRLKTPVSSSVMDER